MVVSARAGVISAVDCGLARVRARIVECLRPIAVREFPVADAVGATLAIALTTGTPLPRVDSAAMDGYAVAGPGPWWRLHPQVRYAGRACSVVLAPGEAVRIATGAATPLGTTATLRDEHTVTTTVSGKPVVMRAPDAPVRDDTRRQGEHWDSGTELAAAGTRVSVALASAALSAEAETVTVRGPVRADVVMTGDEIRAVGPLGVGETRDSLGPVLPEFLRRCDIESTGLWHLADGQDLLRSWLALRSHADLVVMVGATGRGAADHLRALLTELGAHVVIDRIAIRPGGSTLVAQLPDGRVLLGLPGNPLAAVAALLAIGPAVVDALTRRTPGPTMWGRLSDAGVLAGEATRIVPVQQQAGGVWRSTGPAHTPHLAGLIGCQALAVLPPGTGRGTLVELLPLPH
ncbi:molybdopterin biosynthesis protein [Nocardia mangyaensis]|uniref:Molybdopterin molybdenumtransferase n=1 Tax=Nocardia mangyaensis TaxID=2213200 RepID=A0A1J0W2I5_9NOCA|nr:molybdopterin biosynthesis protein [Nocardia mangyaensis]